MLAVGPHAHLVVVLFFAYKLAPVAVAPEGEVESAADDTFPVSFPFDLELHNLLLKYN